MPDGSTIGLVLGSSVFAAGLTQGLAIFREWRAASVSADYSGLYLAMALEAYGRQCSDAISESEIYQYSEGSAGSPQRYVPNFPALPDNIDWRSLGLTFTSEALALPVAVATTNAAISNGWDHGDNDDNIRDVREATAKIGLEAFELAATIRRARSIPEALQHGEWSAQKHLEEREQAYLADRVVETARVDAIIAKLDEVSAERG